MTATPSRSVALPIDLGDGIELVLTTTADAPAAFAVIDAERVRLREWLPWVDTTTSVEDEQGFLETLEFANQEGSGLHLTIRRGPDVLGMIGLRVKLLASGGEIGYWLSAAAVGGGVMTRAVAAVLDAGFAELGLHRIELLAAVGNRRSRAVAERLGMTLEGVRREAEELASGFVDLAAYAVLVDEWPGSAAALARTGDGAGSARNT